MSSLKRLVIVCMFLNLNLAHARDFVPPSPKGFKVSLLGKATNARQMTLSKQGFLYVGSMEANSVYVIREGKTQTLLKDLTYPSGVLWHEGDLYIAEINKISVIRQVDDLVTKGATPKLTSLKTDLPTDLNHGWKYLALKDGWLYFPIGAPCNICAPDAPYGALHRMSLDGKKFETLATGIRNTTGFTFHPVTGDLWFTEHGRDQMGDDLPADEVNILKVGAHYGFPYVHASTTKDPHFYGQMPKGLKVENPVGEIPAHSAPIGIRFTHGTPFEKKFPGCALVALHGSWNRSKKSGYQVVVGCPDKQNRIKKWQPFLTGFLEGKAENTLGRPTDMIFDKTGALLISDDHAGHIWRVETVK